MGLFLTKRLPLFSISSSRESPDRGTQLTGLGRNWAFWCPHDQCENPCTYLQILPRENKPALETMFIITIIDAISSSEGVLKISI